MRILLTAGPTHEPIDAVRYIGNRSSGCMGAEIAAVAVRAGHHVTLILGPATATMPTVNMRIDVQTAAQMHAAVLSEFPGHDLLIMAAAVADFRPRIATLAKIPRDSALTLELEPTPDIVAAASRHKRSDQRVIGFSLEMSGDVRRARHKLSEKRLDMIVCNSPRTIGGETIDATILYADGRSEPLGNLPKGNLATILIERAAGLFSAGSVQPSTDPGRRE